MVRKGRASRRKSGRQGSKHLRDDRQEQGMSFGFGNTEAVDALDKTSFSGTTGAEVR